MKVLSAILRVFGSFGLAVALLFILFLLTWFGTLEQVDHGLYDVQKRYFESWYVVHHLGPVPLLLPGGMKVMVLLALNLFVGGMIRIRWSWRNAGVLVAHFGMALLMLAGAVKLLNSEDGMLRLHEGDERAEFRSSSRFEVVVWDATAPVGPYTEYRIPPGDFRQLTGERTRVFKRNELPFELVLGRFIPNSQIVPAAGIGVPTNPVIEGWTAQFVKPADVSAIAIPALYATVLTPDGGRKQGLLWGNERVPWSFELGGRTWAVSLRPEVYDLPFSLRLEDVRREDYPGMNRPRKFESDVVRAKAGEPDRKVRIYMNNPHREDGYVVFQTDWGIDTRGEYTGLQIVRNPSDQWPKYACYVIGLGLLLAFGQRLLNFLGNERRRFAREVQG